MFGYHMLLQGSERRPLVGSCTKYRPSISMSRKGTVCTKVLISTTQRECSRSPQRTVPHLFSLPSIFECPQMNLSSRPVENLSEQPDCFFFESSVGLVTFVAWRRRGSRIQLEELLETGEERKVSPCPFTYPLGLRSPTPLSIRCIKRSMVAHCEIKYNSACKAGKQAVFSEKRFLYEAKCILLSVNCCRPHQHSAESNLSLESVLKRNLTEKCGHEGNSRVNLARKIKCHFN